MNICLFLLLPFMAMADWSKLPSNEFSLPPYPVKGSAAYARDFAEMHELQETRSQEDCELGRSQEHPTFDTLFGTSWDGLTREEQARARPLIERVLKLGEKIYNYQKDIFRRPRPYTTDTSIAPCATKPGGRKAYPSGHATNGALSGCVLALLFPEKADELAERGNLVGELRVIVGVHHPSDVEAGQSLGRAVCARLQQEPDFQREWR